MKNLAVLAAFLLLIGCASTGSNMAGGATDFDSMVAEAESEMKAAKKSGGLWRDTGKFIDKAKEAAKSGDMEKAMKLVKKAKFEAKMGQEQAAGQKNAGPWLF